MKEVSYWDRFYESGTIEDYLRFKTENAIGPVEPEGQYESSDVSQGNIGMQGYDTAQEKEDYSAGFYYSDRYDY